MDRNFKCIFDTNIFNRILDREVPVEAFSHQVSAYVTHVQRDEINNTRKDDRREQLANKFTDVIPDNENIIPTRSAVWGVSNWGQSMWAEDDLCMTLKLELDKKKSKKNNNKDALIADTAIKGKYVLVTEDRDLKEVTELHGGECWTLNEMLEQTS
ncbi:MAG: putative nucleic acid-binding protein [Paracoccaceae bacterium]|jgi:hypothetical protein